MRKPVFGVCDQVRLKPACSVTETSWSLEISDIETRGIILSRQRIILSRQRINKGADPTVRMHRLIYAYVVRLWQNRFPHDMAHTRLVMEVTALLNIFSYKFYFIPFKIHHYHFRRKSSDDLFFKIQKIILTTTFLYHSSFKK